MDNVESLGKRTENGLMISPEQVLKDAIEMIGKEGAFENGKKLLVLCVDDTDGSYHVSFSQGGMKMSECIALCEVGKTLFLEEMNYL